MTPVWRKTRVPRFLTFSLVAHAALLAVVTGTRLGRGCLPEASPLGVEPERQRGPVDVTLIEPTVLNPFVASPPPEESAAELAKKQEEARKPESDPNLPGQVVDIAQPNVEIRPDDARFVSPYDSKVDHETKAPPGRVGPRPALASVGHAPPATPRVPQIAPAAPRTGGRGIDEAGKLAMRGQGAEGRTEISSDGNEAAQGEAAGPAGATRSAELGRAGQDGAPGDPEQQGLRPSDLRPSEAMLAQVVAAGSNDYLNDVDEGEEQLLNTQRSLHAPFFNRIKNAVAQAWHPERAYRLRDPTGSIYGVKNRYTLLKVSLKPDGSLHGEPLLERPCGVDFLDDEAITAFKEAQPFPHPPPGLVDKESQLITFRFGFYFQVGSAPRFRVFRQ